MCIYVHMYIVRVCICPPEGHWRWRRGCEYVDIDVSPLRSHGVSVAFTKESLLTPHGDGVTSFVLLWGGATY